MIGHIALGLLIAVAPIQVPPQAADPGTAESRIAKVHGQLLSEANGRPLAFAVVELISDEERVSVSADHTGRYVLERVPSGRQLLRAKHIGHTPLEVEVWVPPNGQLSLDFALELRPVALPPVTARGTPVPGAPQSDSSRLSSLPAIGVAGVQALGSSPGFAELGLLEVGRDVLNPDPPDPSDILYVRGSTVDLKRVLLDGAPVTAPFHLGGLMEGFEPEALRSAQLYLGGAPARHDGGLSYILDLQTRPGYRDRARTEARLDLLSAAARTEGPIGSRGGYLFSGRRLHGNNAAGLLEEPSPYGYFDGLARVDVQLGRGVLAATGFLNRESVRIDRPASIRPDASWGNAAGSMRYRGSLAAHDVEATVAFGRYTARLPLAGEVAMDAEAVSDQTRLALDLSRDSGPLRIQYGLGYERYDVASTARILGLQATDSMTMSTQTGGEVAGAYLDVGWELHPSLRLRGGLRSDLFISERTPRLAPRLAATWLVTERAALTIAAGRYHQYVGMTTTAPEIEHSVAPTGDFHSLTPFFEVAGASHLRVALDQGLSEGLRLGIEAYTKRFWDLPVIEQEETQSASEAQSAGVDLWVHRGTGRVTGWLGYSLGWAWSGGPEDNGSSFSGRHVLSGGLGAPLGSTGRLSLRLAYGAGLPYSAIPHRPPTQEAMALDAGQAIRIASAGFHADANLGSAAQQHEPVGPFLRVDAEVSRTWTSNWAGLNWEITPYLKVLNALDRRDALFYLGDAAGVPQAVAPLPILPVIGVNWKF
jgi:hypothetical protein